MSSPVVTITVAQSQTLSRLTTCAAVAAECSFGDTGRLYARFEKSVSVIELDGSVAHYGIGENKA